MDEVIIPKQRASRQLFTKQPRHRCDMPRLWSVWSEHEGIKTVELPHNTIMRCGTCGKWWRVYGGDMQCWWKPVSWLWTPRLWWRSRSEQTSVV
jgi:hypothetical protein